MNAPCLRTSTEAPLTGAPALSRTVISKNPSCAMLLNLYPRRVKRRARAANPEARMVVAAHAPVISNQLAHCLAEVTVSHIGGRRLRRALSQQIRLPAEYQHVAPLLRQVDLIVVVRDDADAPEILNLQRPCRGCASIRHRIEAYESVVISVAQRIVVGAPGGLLIGDPVREPGVVNVAQLLIRLAIGVQQAREHRRLECGGKRIGCRPVHQCDIAAGAFREAPVETVHAHAHPVDAVERLRPHVVLVLAADDARHLADHVVAGGAAGLSASACLYNYGAHVCVSTTAPSTSGFTSGGLYSTIRLSICS